MKTEKEPDEKVWCSVDIKLNMGEYESVAVSAGYATSLRPGETPAIALARAVAVVDKEVIERALSVRKGKFKKVLR